MKSGLIIFFSLIFCFDVITPLYAKLKKSEEQHQAHITPQAKDLLNHYGAPSFIGKYGPQQNQYAQWVEANPDTFNPIQNDKAVKILKKLEFKPHPDSNTKFNPDPIKSGDMTNIAPSATKIISPEIADPKLKIEAHAVYPAVVAVPTFKGLKKEFHDVTAYDKQTGQIVHDKVIIERPEIVMEKEVMNISHPFEHTVNLKTGEVVKNEQVATFHELK